MDRDVPPKLNHKWGVRVSGTIMELECLWCGQIKKESHNCTLSALFDKDGFIDGYMCYECGTIREAD